MFSLSSAFVVRHSDLGFPPTSRGIQSGGFSFMVQGRLGFPPVGFAQNNSPSELQPNLSLRPGSV